MLPGTILTFIGYIMKHKDSHLIMSINRRLGDCHILIAECEAVREAILITINKEIPWVIIDSDSQVVVNDIIGDWEFLRIL